MKYGEFIDELLSRLKLDNNTAANRTKAGEKVNLAYGEIGNNAGADWEHLKRYGEIRTIPNVTAGTVTWTKDGYAVTGSGTAWDSSMAGRFFQPEGSDNWYEINYVESATSLVLKTQIIEASASGQTYAIWNRFYYFPSEMRKLIEFGSWIRDGILVEKSINSVRDFNPVISNTGEPREFFIHGADSYGSSYSTGSVTLVENSDVLAGAGTSWLGNAGPGDLITIGSLNFRVKRVESDTRIIMLNRSTNAQASVTYEIKNLDRIGFQLWYNPDKAYLLPYTYQKRVYDMVNESYDRPELPPEFDLAILDGAESRYLADRNDDRWVNIQALYSARIKDLKSNRFLSSQRFRQMRPRVDSRGAYQ